MSDAVPLLGFFSLQRSSAREIRLPRWLPHHRHLASSGFFALSTPCSLSSLPTVARRAAPGIPPSGLCSCRQVRRPFGHVPSLPDVTHPDRRTLAMNERSDPVQQRGDQSSREIRVGRLQGLSCRQSVPLHLLFKVMQRPMPSWFSSSPRLSPPSLPNGRHRSPRSRASSPIVSLASHDRSCATACCQTRAVALSLSRLPAFPRFLPWVSPPIRKTRRRWVIVFPSRTEARYRSSGSPIRTA